ncbi:LysR substrate-binding domain-containing protein [Tistrella bauzanensis]|jgi:LysR family glycine cleavage system transcriptional activator|uniref:LysR substrate-binding domain-containing protein n=1 Tax=Tistrella arctica TaxID=3133430 RepID=A0ABU9YDU3_9PROT
MTQLPPFRSIEAFVVAARRRSLTAAADELGLSLPALSRRIGVLEAHIGSPLLVRLPRGVEPTALGAAYAADLAPTVMALHRATDAARAAARGRPDRQTVRISLIPTLAVTWLLPRMAAFHAANPEIAIDLDGSATCVDLAAGHADLAIRLGQGRWRGTDALPLMALDLQPVCSPAWLADHPAGLNEPRDLYRAALLGPGHRPEFWPEWAWAQGLDADALPPVRTFDSLQMLYEAAAQGLGVAIGLDRLVQPWITAGRLVRPIAGKVVSLRGFHLVTPAGAVPRAPVRVVSDWLRAEARRDGNAARLAVS